MKKKLSLVWIYPASLQNALDRATWIETAKHLSLLGWDVTLLATDFPDGDYPFVTIKVQKPEIYFWGYLSLQYAIFKKITRSVHNYEMVLGDQESFPAIFLLKMYLWFRKQKSPKIVMDIRTLPMSYRSAKLFLHSVYTWACIFLAHWLFDGETTITSRMAQVLKIPGRKLVSIWPSGVDNSRFDGALPVRAWPKPENETLVLIYIGAIVMERHLEELCQAVVDANEKGAKVRLKIVGDGPAKKQLSILAEQNAQDLIQIDGPYPYHYIPGLLSQAHVGVLPFPDQLMFQVSSPIKLFEYMASGLPVLATRIVCHTTVCKDSYTFWAEGGEPFQLADAILAAWNSRSALESMGMAARLDSVNWSWSESALKLSTGLEELL